MEPDRLSAPPSTLRETQIDIALANIGLYDKYPLLKQAKKSCIRYIMTFIKKRFGTLSRVLSILITLAKEKEPENYSDTKTIIAYAQYELTDFAASKFITDFVGKTLNKILLAFDFINEKTRLPADIKTMSIYDRIVHIFDVCLMMDLANIFALLEFSVKIECSHIINYDLVETLCHISKDLLIHNHEKINYKFISAKHPFTDIIYKDRLDDLLSPSQKENILTKIFKSIYDLLLSTKILLDHENKKDIISDFEIITMVGTSNILNKIKKSCMTVRPENFFKYKLINYISTAKTNLKTDIDFEPDTVITDLRIPIADITFAPTSDIIEL